jgi:hypothetical protein
MFLSLTFLLFMFDGKVIAGNIWGLTTSTTSDCAMDSSPIIGSPCSTLGATGPCELVQGPTASCSPTTIIHGTCTCMY